MNKISSLQELNDLIQKTKTCTTKIISNYSFMADEITPYIEQKKMQFQLSPHSLLLFLDEGDYYRLLFWADSAYPFSVPKLDRKIICEVLFYRNKPTQLLPFTSSLASAGFKEYAENWQIMFDLSKISFDDLSGEKMERLRQNGYMIRSAVKSDDSNIFRLWKHYLDPYAFNWLQINRCSTFSNDTEILVLESPSHIVCGVTVMFSRGNICEHRHIAIDENFRGMNLGYLLLLNSLCIFQEKGYKKCISWIEKNNIRSIRMHSKIGTLTNKACKQYLL